MIFPWTLFASSWFYFFCLYYYCTVCCLLDMWCTFLIATNVYLFNISLYIWLLIVWSSECLYSCYIDSISFYIVILCLVCWFWACFQILASNLPNYLHFGSYQLKNDLLYVKSFLRCATSDQQIYCSMDNELALYLVSLTWGDQADRIRPYNLCQSQDDSVSIQLKTRHWPNRRTNIWINLGYSCSWKYVSKNPHKPSSEYTHVVSMCNGFTWILLLIHLDLRGTVTMLRMLAIFETCHPLADALRDPRSVKWDEICVDLLRLKWWCSCWSCDNKHPVLGLRIDEIAHLSIVKMNQYYDQDLWSISDWRFIHWNPFAVDKTYRTNLNMPDRYGLSLRLDPWIMFDEGDTRAIPFEVSTIDWMILQEVDCEL